MQGDTRSEIEAANREFMDAFAQGDAAGLVSLYTADGQLLPPNSDIVTGHDVLVSYWQGVMDSGVKAVLLEIDEVERFGDTAYEVGHATILGGDDQVFDREKYIVVWKQQDGQWKLHRGIFNSSMPAGTQ